MDASVITSDTASGTVSPERDIRSARPVNPGSLQRKNRWKRRGRSVLNRRITIFAVASLMGLALVLFFQMNSETQDKGPEGAVAITVYEAFPEADPQRIEVTEKEGLPNTVTLHLPAHMIEPSRGINNPFALLGAEFGRTERTLSGVEMAKRLEQAVGALLPSDMVKCYTYDVGAISSPPEARHRTRSLHLYLNPVC